MIKARVHVSLRPVVLDPQGKAVSHSLVDLGFSEVKSARIGKFIDLEIEGDVSTPAAKKALEDRLKQMAKQVFANPVLEDYAVEILQ